MIKTVNLPRKFLVKAALLVIVTTTLFLSVSPLTFREIEPVHRTIRTNIRAAYHHIVNSGNYNLDRDSYFLRRFTDITQQKRATDSDNQLWDLEDHPQYPLALPIPKYYKEVDPQISKKPAVQPFDPRFTISIYLDHLRSAPTEVPFHWSDWVDLSKLNRYILNPAAIPDPCTALFDIQHHPELMIGSVVLHPSLYCTVDQAFPLGYRITKFSGQQTEFNYGVLGKSYLYSSAPAPSKLVFLTGDGSYQVDVQDSDNNSLEHALLRNGMVEQVIHSGKSSKDTTNIKKSYLNLQKDRPLGESVQFMEHTMHIPESQFDVDPVAIINDIEGRDLTKVEAKYLESLKYSVAETNPPKYFYEAKLLQSSENYWLGEHYDWRFFDGLTVGHESHLILLHRLLKNYLNFTRSHGINTWIAHGSLLSWYWNGMAFPWDSDIDVQMPIGDLHKLAREFNQTLVIENPVHGEDNEFDGLGRYFVDVGSSITHRTRGNGNNNIDARFIDVDSGLYIDITGLALTNTPVPDRLRHLLNETAHESTTKDIKAYNCRNLHYYTHEELSPLVMTVVENHLSYVPSNFVLSLNAEYSSKALTNWNFGNYYYNSNLRMWLESQQVLEYIAHPRRWVRMHNSTGEEVVRGTRRTRAPKVVRVVGEFEKLRLAALDIDDHLNLLHHDGIFKEYTTTREFTKFHEVEMSLLLDPLASESHERLLSKYQAGAGLRPDLFMDAVMKQEGMDYEERLDHLVQLAELYDGGNIE